MQEELDELTRKFPLVAKHSKNYAARIIQRAWNKYMARVTYKYLLKCCKDFESTLTPKDLSRIYPEFLESSDPRMSAKLQIRMQGISFPPCLVCRIVSDQTPSVDGKKHSPKWIPLFNSGHSQNSIDQKALVRLYLEAQHLKNDEELQKQKEKDTTRTLRPASKMSKAPKEKSTQDTRPSTRTNAATEPVNTTAPSSAKSQKK